MQVTLKKVWNIAICVAGFVNKRSKISALNDFHINNSTAKTIEPITLNNKWITLARLAFTDVPIDTCGAACGVLFVICAVILSAYVRNKKI